MEPDQPSSSSQESRIEPAAMLRKREYEDEPSIAGGESPSDDEDVSMDQDGPRDKLRIAEVRPICTSCEQCQLRKGKCDRGQPVCGWCAANNKVCEYKERKKPGLRAGYGRNLERRLDMVEEKLEAQARTIEQLEHSRSLPQLTTTYAATSHLSPSPAATHAHSASSTNIPQVYAPARSRTHSNVFAPSWTDSPQASLHESSFSDPHGTHLSPAIIDDPATIDSSQPFSSDPDLPPADILFNLVDLYFLHINQWFPLLDRRASLEGLFGTNPWTEGDRILLHAITATCVRFCTDQRLDDASRQRYHTRSKRKVLLYGIENVSVAALQALVIVALNYIGARNGGPGLNLLALIVRSAVQLGLSKETYSSPVLPAYTSNSTLGINVLPPARDWVEDEGRRRLFWLIYILDRDATVATAFDFALDEKDIDRKLPCKDELYVLNKAVDTKWFQTSERSNYSVNDPGTLGSLSYMVELKGLLTKIHQFLKRPVDIGAVADVEQWQATYRELDEALRKWRQNLPSEFRNLDRIKNPTRNPVDCSWILLQATYFTVSIRLHSAAAYPPHKSPIFSPSYSAAQLCYQETENIVSLSRYVLSNGLLPQLGPPFAFVLWVGARVLLVHGSTIEKQVNPAVQYLLDMLRQLGVLWPIAARYAAILRRVMDDYRENQAASATGTSNPTNTVPILADMRRCAYDLDLLITSHHGGYGRGPGGGQQQQQQQQQPVQKRNRRRQSTQQTTPSTASSTHWWPQNQNQAGLASGTRFPDTSELEYLEAFDFFNYPRLPGTVGGVATTPSFDVTSTGHINIDQFTVDPGADWLVGNFN